MTVAIARVTLVLAAARSLKDKRSVVKRLKDQVRQKFNVSIAEVEAPDVWNRAVLGLTLVGPDRRFTESAIDEVLRFVRDHAPVAQDEHELQDFGGGALNGPDFTHWEG
ncbi:MAG TPA: DUF503 domain-containing protein [Polyangia bacterium]|nr:DUF503 domain-containing protein [Polyangia bacterium]